MRKKTILSEQSLLAAPLSPSERKQKEWQPSNDPIFKHIFGQEANASLLISLLNQILRWPDPIKKVKFENVEFLQDHLNHRGLKFDLLLTTESEAKINLEMQKGRFSYMPARLEYNLSRIHGAQLDKADKYQDIKPTVVVALMDYLYFKDDRPLRSFSIRDDLTGESLGGKTSIYMLEIPKMASLIEQTLLVGYCKFIHNVEDPMLEEFYKQYPELKKARKDYESFVADPAMREAIRQLTKADRDRASELYEYQEIGRAEGIEQGRVEGKAEGIEQGKVEGITEERARTAKAMLKQNIDLQVIVQITNLTEQEIAKLQELNDQDQK